MNADTFRHQVTQKLQTNASRVLLRVLLSRADTGPVELTGADILTRSLELTDRYSDAPTGGVVLLLLPHSTELFLLHIGLLLRGHLPAILAWPTNRVDVEKYQRNVLHQLRNLPATQLLTLPTLAANLDPGLPYRVTAFPIEHWARAQESFAVKLDVAPVPKRIRGKAAADTPEHALFLQFSGGTTGAQKCVVVTADMLVEQLGRLSSCLGFTREDGVASWLPLYHDMGLIACLWLPLWMEASSVHCSAADWLMEPGLLFRLMHRHRATFTWLPNFAFSYLASQRKRIRENGTLSHVRAWINCSEPVRRRSLVGFSQAFAGLRVRLDQCQASYAMAENVFAVTQTPLGAIPSTVPRASVSRETREEKGLAFDLLDDVYVSSGRTLEGVGLRVRDADGRLCQDRSPGGIEICGPGLFTGYWGNDGFQRQSLTSDGWYATGDYGFTDGLDLYVIGRTKDLVIVGGQNVFPEDVEAVAAAVEGVYPGRAVAFGIQDEGFGTESLVVVAEMRGAFDTAKAIAIQGELQRLILASIGVAPRHVLVVPERWIVKSTAGKISRGETRARFLQGRTAPRTGEP